MKNLTHDKQEATMRNANRIDLNNPITIRDFIKTAPTGRYYMLARNEYVYVSHIRWPETNPWAVCPEENAGFGLSYCVHYDVNLYPEKPVS